MVVCTNYTDVCTTISYHNGGRTERGCSSEILPDNYDNTMAVYENCLDNNCNNNVFPAKRPVCHQCVEHCNEVEDNTINVCRQYDINEHCYAFIDPGKLQFLIL